MVRTYFGKIWPIVCLILVILFEFWVQAFWSWWSTSERFPDPKFLLAKLKAWSLKTGSVMLFSTHLVSLSTSTFLASCYNSFQIWLPSLENNVFPAVHCQWKSGDACQGWVIFQHERRGGLGRGGGPNHFFSYLSCGQDHRPNFPSHGVTDSDSEIRTWFWFEISAVFGDR